MPTLIKQFSFDVIFFILHIKKGFRAVKEEEMLSMCPIAWTWKNIFLRAPYKTESDYIWNCLSRGLKNIEGNIWLLLNVILSIY